MADGTMLFPDTAGGNWKMAVTWNEKDMCSILSDWLGEAT